MRGLFSKCHLRFGSTSFCVTYKGPGQVLRAVCTPSFTTLPVGLYMCGPVYE